MKKNRKLFLPTWNLAALYAAPDAPALRRDQAEIDAAVADFRARYENKVEKLSGADLGRAVAEYDALCARRIRIENYAYLFSAKDITASDRTAPVLAWSEEFEKQLFFFERAVQKMNERDLLTKMIAPGLSRYAPWIALQRTLRPRPTPAGETERLRRYNELMEKVAATEDVESELVALKAAAPRVAAIYNDVIASQARESARAGFAKPDHATHYGNGLMPEAVETMFSVLTAAYPRLSQRFSAWQQKKEAAETEILPSDTLSGRFADATEKPRMYSWGAAKKLVLSAFRRFSPRFGRIAQKFFDERRIDAAPQEGKQDSAFAMPMGRGELPFILLNYQGEATDVVNHIAHELGHGVHQVLTERSCGLLLSMTPDTISEVASTFAETMVFEALLREEKGARRRHALREERCGEIIDSVLGQISSYDFERRAHEAARTGPLSADQLCDLWVETQRACCGPGAAADEESRYHWMTVSHFFETPFYTYAYAFAQMTAAALWELYKKDPKDFVPKYIELLETGLTRNMHEMLSPFGLDPADPAFWQAGIAQMERQIDRLGVPPLAPAPAVKNPPAPQMGQL